MKQSKPTPPRKPDGPSIFSLLGPYRHWIAGMVVLTILANSLNLAVPKIMAGIIERYDQPGFALSTVLLEFFGIAAGIFVLTYLQNIVQTVAAERIARDLRTRLVAKISVQDHAYIQQVTPAKLLTNLTSDVDSIKMFVSQAIAAIISSLFLIIGAGILLLLIDWKLGLAVLAILPIIGGTFAKSDTAKELQKRGAFIGANGQSGVKGAAAEAVRRINQLLGIKG